MYSVIMAGGRGSRFWPRSRKKNSKQTQNIVGRHTMIQDTVRRLEPVSGADRILIVTNHLLVDRIREQVPSIPEQNILVEPMSRSTAPCIGMAAVVIESREPGAVMACFAADHLIENRAAFENNVRFACGVAEETEDLVIFGIPPVRPDAGFGYIKAGKQVSGETGNAAYRVEKFIEKPDLDTARKLVGDGGYYINSGMFVWKASAFLRELEKYQPAMHAGLMNIKEAMDTPMELKALGENFRDFESLSVDYAILEKADRVLMVPAGFGWNDIGSWECLYHAWPKDEDGNAAPGRKLTVDTKDCLIYSPKKLVATIGLEDVIIVETDDALLVCRKDRAQDVSMIIDILREKRWEEYL